MDVPKSLDFVATPTAPGVRLEFGTEELSDIVELYYASCETYIKVMADGVIKTDDLLILNKPLFALFSAVTGISTALVEIMDLTDAEILDLVALDSNYNLGEQKEVFKQILKNILFTIQTYSVFRK